ncbi:unnamed protein product [Protopolystoma xenopodis]|uniref:Uncharacterized protein n=1 Tax=Protopolystoma xenopodis TaxID=117903 RepID=A0A3S4ZC49_9PLAT|nr:unnamed protein product [Protopolystoma xenopodis]
MWLRILLQAVRDYADLSLMYETPDDQAEFAFICLFFKSPQLDIVSSVDPLPTTTSSPNTSCAVSCPAAPTFTSYTSSLSRKNSFNQVSFIRLHRLLDLEACLLNAIAFLNRLAILTSKLCTGSFLSNSCPSAGVHQFKNLFHARLLRSDWLPEAEPNSTAALLSRARRRALFTNALAQVCLAFVQRHIGPEDLVFDLFGSVLPEPLGSQHETELQDQVSWFLLSKTDSESTRSVGDDLQFDSDSTRLIDVRRCLAEAIFRVLGANPSATFDVNWPNPMAARLLAERARGLLENIITAPGDSASWIEACLWAAGSSSYLNDGQIHQRPLFYAVAGIETITPKRLTEVEDFRLRLARYALTCADHTVHCPTELSIFVLPRLAQLVCTAELWLDQALESSCQQQQQQKTHISSPFLSIYPPFAVMPEEPTYTISSPERLLWHTFLHSAAGLPEPSGPLYGVDMARLWALATVELSSKDLALSLAYAAGPPTIMAWRRGRGRPSPSEKRFDADRFVSEDSKASAQVIYWPAVLASVIWAQQENMRESPDQPSQLESSLHSWRLLAMSAAFESEMSPHQKNLGYSDANQGPMPSQNFDYIMAGLQNPLFDEACRSWLTSWIQDAIGYRIIENIKALEPGLPLDAFISDSKDDLVRRTAIFRISQRHLRFGLILARRYQIPPEKVIYARLEALLDDHSCPELHKETSGHDEPEQLEVQVDRLIELYLTMPGAGLSGLIASIADSLYPHLPPERLLLLLRSILQTINKPVQISQLDSETGLFLLHGLPLSSHISLLSLLSPSLSTFSSFDYAGFLRCAMLPAGTNSSPDQQQRQLNRTRLLRQIWPQLNSTLAARILIKLMETLSAEVELCSSSISALRPSTEASFQSFKQDSDSLTSLPVCVTFRSSEVFSLLAIRWVIKTTKSATEIPDPVNSTSEINDHIDLSVDLPPPWNQLLHDCVDVFPGICELNLDENKSNSQLGRPGLLSSWVFSILFTRLALRLPIHFRLALLQEASRFANRLADLLGSHVPKGD